MTLKEIKAMFRPGQPWRVNRTGGGKHADETRRVHKTASKDLIWKTPDGHLLWTQWPRASEVQEARPGFLQFIYAGSSGMVVTFTAVV